MCIRDRINTKPDGAEVVCDGVPIGTSPTVVKVLPGETRECFARAEGFNDYPFKLNSVLTDNTEMTLTLVKPPKGTPAQRTKPPENKVPAGTGSGSATKVPGSTTGGEISPNPYGNVDKK